MAAIAALLDRPESYVAAVRRIPMLEEAEEADLAWRYASGDRAAGDRIVESHLRLVVKQAFGLRGYGLPLADLIAEGNLGLLEALRRYEPERGLRFATYAGWWVRASMLEYVLRQSSPVKIGMSADRKRLFFKLRALKARFAPGGGALSEDNVRAVAENLGVREERVREMEGLLSSANSLSLDAPVGEDGSATLKDLLADERPDPEAQAAEHEERALRRRLVRDAWRGLSEREQRIVAERQLRETPLRLEDLAKIYGVSRERIRQIEVAAMKKLRRLIGAERLSGALAQGA